MSISRNLSIFADAVSTSGNSVTAVAIPTLTSASSLTFQTNGTTTAMTIDTSQNVGIGNASPSYKLDVTGTSRATTSFISPILNGATTLSLQTGGTTGLYIDVSQNVGIGTTTTTNGKLSVTTATNYPGLYITDGTYAGAITPSSLGGMALVSNGAYPQIFFVNSAERMRIDSSGTLLVGKTSSASNVLGAGFATADGTNQWRCSIGNSGSTSAAYGLSIYSTGASGYRFYVDMAGTVFATSAVISVISDQRLKENVRDLDVGLGAIMALKPRLYDWKEGKGANIKNAHGFIAQEFEKVFPDLIGKWADPSPEGEEPYKSVRQDLIPVLVKAIQELSAKVTALESK